MISWHSMFIATFLFLLMVISFCVHSFGTGWHCKVLLITGCHSQVAPHTILAMPSHKPRCFSTPVCSPKISFECINFGAVPIILFSLNLSTWRDCVCLRGKKFDTHWREGYIHQRRDGASCATLGWWSSWNQLDAGWSFLTPRYVLLWAWITFAKCKTSVFIELSQKVSLLKKDF